MSDFKWGEEGEGVKTYLSFSLFLDRWWVPMIHLPRKKVGGGFDKRLRNFMNYYFKVR